MKAAAVTEKEREFLFTDDDFRFVVATVYEHTGIQLSDSKRDMVYSRLARRLRKLHLTKFSDYCRLVQSPNSPEIGEFINALTTNLTSFFRESHHFDHLEKTVLQGIVNSKPADKKIRIWSAGCSAGMEPYTIAMVVHKFFSAAGSSGWDIKILATDIDTNMLKTGKEGVYSMTQLEKIPQVYRKYLSIDEADESIHMNDELKKYITFNRLNLLESWPINGHFDVIFCRNVAIYFDKETQLNLFKRLADRLKPKSWFYIGHSENLLDVAKRFKSAGKTTFQRID